MLLGRLLLRQSPVGVRRYSRLPSKSLEKVLSGNRRFVDSKKKEDSKFFEKLASAPHTPEFLWIGCSDARVPANIITGLEAGELFVHRNIANLVVAADLNLLSVLQYSVETLKVDHVILCGHYGCGGVKAATNIQDHGLLENWLRNIRDVQRLHLDELTAIPDEDQRYRRLVELNVEEQCYNLFKTGIIQKSLKARKAPWIHGCVYDLADGEMHELDIDFQGYHDKYGHLYSLYDDDEKS